MIVRGVAAIAEPESRLQVETLERNVAEFGIPYVPLQSRYQGIVHIIGPELGLTLPGTTIVCGDSHTSAHGAFGALAFGIGTSEAEHVLATQTLVQRRAKSMLIRIDHRLGTGVTAKDLILHIIGQIGTAGATGYVIEYAGDAVTALDMAGRMTLCNMSIEAGARAGMIAPDDKVFDWLAQTPFALKGDALERAMDYWRTLHSDADAELDRTVIIDGRDVAPMVTWGTSPEAVTTIEGSIPDPAMITDDAKRAQTNAMLAYMGLEAGQPIKGTPIEMVFIGSCTNGRIEDLRAAAAMVGDRHVAPNVRALVVPGSGQVKAAAEAEGIDKIFLDAGFEWREAGCSMCLGRPGGRTHLMSPAMAATAAINGCIVDAREF
jgi:3-isopropylmalate/(R)-2-methylmalate dehydratase large subunit